MRCKEKERKIISSAAYIKTRSFCFYIIFVHFESLTLFESLQLYGDKITESRCVGIGRHRNFELTSEHSINN